MKEIFTDFYNKIVDFFSKTEEKDKTKDIARNRLKLVLMQDRTNLNPKLLERLRGEIIDLLSKYVVMDKELLELNFTPEDDQLALMLSIPVIRAKNEEEIEEALKAEDEEKERLAKLILEAEAEAEEDEDEDEDEEIIWVEDDDESDEDDDDDDDDDFEDAIVTEENLEDENLQDEDVIVVLDSDVFEPDENGENSEISSNQEERPKKKKKKKNKKKKLHITEDSESLNKTDEEKSETVSEQENNQQGSTENTTDEHTETSENE